MENQNLHDLINRITDKFPQIHTSTDASGIGVIESTSENSKAIIEFLKNECGFNFLTDICGVHFPSNTDFDFQVVYHLHNLFHNLRLRIKVKVSSQNLAVESIHDLYSGANWMERETFDFYGINFTGHPDMRRILNMEDMDYHPLRKEYALEDETRTDKNDSFFGR